MAYEYSFLSNSPQGCWLYSGSLDSFSVTQTFEGEGNGNPLQYYCLENPMDRGPWWAAVYGVAQSQTQLKRLSSSKHLNLFSFLFCPSSFAQWHPTPVLSPENSHEWRSLLGCSSWGCWESDTTERLHLYFSLSCIGEGNGNPLQWSSLENPRDGGAWWAAIYGFAQSRTRLKWFSSSFAQKRSFIFSFLTWLAHSFFWVSIQISLIQRDHSMW